MMKKVSNNQALPNIDEILREFKEKLSVIYGDRLVKLVLYGSWARGQGGHESDIDTIVVLKGDVSPGKEIDRIIDMLTDMNLKYDSLLSVYPMSEKAFYTRRSPLLINVRREGREV